MTNNNVTQTTDKQPAQPAKFTITAAIDGFPVQVEVEGKAENLRAMIDRLKSIGAEPPQTVKPEPTKAAGAPLCTVHNSPMKASRKLGSFFCPKRLADGDYCPEKA